MLRLLITTSIFLWSLSSYSQRWESVQETKTGRLDLYWYTSVPFIYEDNANNLTGIEFEIVELFKTYMEETKGIDIQLNWIKTEDFSAILNEIYTSKLANKVGVSALSITDERARNARFTNPYLPDIAVLVSSKGTPIVRTFDEINAMMNKMEAITIKDTNYEDLLTELQRQLKIEFPIKYINSDRNILESLVNNENQFAYIDLPIYLMLMKGGGDLTRQNFFTIRGEGYSFILPKESDWYLPLNEFFRDERNQKDLFEIFSKYLGSELSSFIQGIDADGQLNTSLLTKEKELQLELIRNANLKLEEEKTTRMILIIGLIIIVIFFLGAGYLFVKNQRSAKLLIGQKDQIYQQQEDIRLTNESLMNRNAQLMSINEEKNNLVKILAHDIRSPLSQIIMISEILQKPSEEALEMKEELLKQVGASAERINDMVTKILDMDNLEEDKMKVMRERVDIREIMKDIKNRYGEQAQKKQIDLRVRTCESNYIIRTDHLLLTLVLENLVSNAIKFSPSETSIYLTADCKYDGVLFKVSDEGPGFTEDDKRLLFNRFQKLSAKPTAGESSIGLGLSIVKKYVNDMGGEIWLESEKDKGSTFFVKFTI